jgi:hypothetical protein
VQLPPGNRFQFNHEWRLTLFSSSTNLSQNLYITNPIKEDVKKKLFSLPSRETRVL